MRVLLTRPLSDSMETAKKLALMGHEGVIAPLLEIRLRDGPELSLERVQAVLATSANGVRALARRTRDRSVPIFAVGPQSERAALDAGFIRVRCAMGDGTALALATRNWATPDGGELLHVAGVETKGNLLHLLEAEGFHTRREILYEAVGSASLDPAIAEQVRNDRIHAVAIYSPRSARIFEHCADQQGLKVACRRMILLAISEACVNAFSDLEFRETRIAASPDQDAMLALFR
jgi:uroporphyrinogen-III synthase